MAPTHTTTTTTGSCHFPSFPLSVIALIFSTFRWNPFDPVRNWPDLGERFIQGERLLRLGPDAATATTATFPNTVASNPSTSSDNDDPVANEAGLPPVEKVSHDRRDLDWSTVLKRTFEAYVRGERPNMYGEWLVW